MYKQQINTLTAIPTGTIFKSRRQILKHSIVLDRFIRQKKRKNKGKTTWKEQRKQTWSCFKVCDGLRGHLLVVFKGRWLETDEPRRGARWSMIPYLISSEWEFRVLWNRIQCHVGMRVLLWSESSSSSVHFLPHFHSHQYHLFFPLCFN